MHAFEIEYHSLYSSQDIFTTMIGFATFLQIYNRSNSDFIVNLTSPSHESIVRTEHVQQ